MCNYYLIAVLLDQMLVCRVEIYHLNWNLLQVDAALDLSHTQNIGRMIKTHFPHSQVHFLSMRLDFFISISMF